ncbi:hypothetical protein FH972_010178 [Carpinus fangiana]|uniref:Uncharacterized protein n=1 Tax=Carpinus fangiana TaxID=176857 RepID=A0A660KMH5_9ROSI|nr:hypothetical protein FH972_010178 [Carpinus fangiana]
MGQPKELVWAWGMQELIVKGPNLCTWKSKARKGNSTAVSVGVGHNSSKKRHEKLSDEDRERISTGRQAAEIDGYGGRWVNAPVKGKKGNTI